MGPSRRSAQSRITFHITTTASSHVYVAVSTATVRHGAKGVFVSIRSALVASAIAAVLACVSTACSDQASAPNATPAVGTDLETATAHSQGLDGPTLVGLAHWIRDTPGLPIFSILISRHDKLVFELYTGGIERPQAHYMMSVSKSVLSSLVGAALKTGAIKSLDTPISQLLSRSLFASDADASRFSGIRQEPEPDVPCLASGFRFLSVSE
jgi:hypothetical protein